MKCILSPMYGKDNDKNITFYCDYCDKEMGYEEDRECSATPVKCECGDYLTSSGYSVGVCLNCDKKIE